MLREEEKATWPGLICSALECCLCEQKRKTPSERLAEVGLCIFGSTSDGQRLYLLREGGAVLSVGCKTQGCILTLVFLLEALVKFLHGLCLA